MAFQKKWEPAHTDYTLALVRKDGRRQPHYLPYVWDNEADAQAMADKKNARYTHGTLVVEATERPAGYSYSGTLPL